MGNETPVPRRLLTIVRSMACKHSRWLLGAVEAVRKLATAEGKAAVTLAVSSSRASSGVSHFVAARNAV